jgi:hypothetical protein
MTNDEVAAATVGAIAAAEAPYTGWFMATLSFNVIGCVLSGDNCR